ncbi:MAG: ATP-binding protein [Deltaproteobacteria bacterium]|nr:ATP-binding protein [Deltaproteobacteria bacterium]
MKLGVRGRLFVTSAAVIVGIGAGAMGLAEREVRRVLGDWTATHLQAEARMVAPWVRTRPAGEVIEIAQGLAHATGAEVAVLAGAADARSPAALRIVADSTKRGMDGDTIAGLPEVRAAWIAGEGRWIGREKCASPVEHGVPCVEDGVAVALRWKDPSGTGIVRLRRNLVEVNRAVAYVRRVLLLAGLVGLGAALVMSGLASHLLSRTLSRIVERSRAMARGEGGRIVVPPDDALEGLAGSINTLGAELERTLDETTRQRDLLATVLAGMADGVVALDRDLRVTASNPAAEALLGVPGHDARPFLIEWIRSPDLLAAASRARDGVPDEAEFDLPWPHHRRVLAGAHPLSQGGCLLVLRDVTETRRLEAVRTDFVANASHELRTPVAAIRASLEALAEGAASDPEAGQAFLEAAQRNALRLSRLVDDLLDITRLEAGRREVTPAATALAPLVASALGPVRHAAEAKGLTLVVDVAREVEACVDPAALEQVLANLLDNAVKYTPQGGRVEVAVARETERIRIEVRDTGPGIPPPHRGRVFERFHRVDPGRSRELGGTGLGLAIVKHLVDAMGGDVSLECPDTGGSIFRVRLPAIEPSSTCHQDATDGR